MKQNVGETDKHFRFVAAGALLATALVGRLSWPWRIATLLLGASELMSATTGHCAINSLLGVDTNREPANDGSLPQPTITLQGAITENEIRQVTE